MTVEALVILCAILLVSYAARFVPEPKARQWIILAASYFFYVHWAGWWFLLILIASSLLNFLWGSLLRRRPTPGLLWIGVGLNVLLLSFFKYLPPLASQWPGSSWEPDFFKSIVLPLGISFWTFQGLSYLFDVYREEELDPSLAEFCLYMAFWPTVVSGPVCRLPKMLPQFRQVENSSWRDDFSVGAIRIVQGLFLKFVLAYILSSGLTSGAGVAAGFDEIAPARSGLDVWALAIGFGFQIFFDFAGYSNMVIGAARLMGIRIPENFDRPYLSPTPAIFWTRWHMSLSFWIRDYVFLPLAALRRHPRWPYAAMVISMVVFGFWHGAKLTYIAWGLYHGALLVGHRMGQQLKRWDGCALPQTIGSFLSWAATFLLVSLGYIFFRANDLDQALDLFKAVLTPASYARTTTLPRDYYLLVGLMAGGYFTYAGLAQLVALWTARYREGVLSFAHALSAGRTAGRAVLGHTVLTLDGVVSKNRWWLLAPACGLLLVVTALSFFGQTSSIAPFIYTLF
jgi:alginate O-acetyltransferase complex protein AlgI